MTTSCDDVCSEILIGQVRKCRCEYCLDGIKSRGEDGDLVQPFRRDIEQLGFLDVCPVMLRKIAKSRMIHDEASHLW